MSLKINLEFEIPVFKTEVLNLYDRTIRLWSFTYLPGYNAIDFNITTDNNREYRVRKKTIRWTVNVLDFFEIGRNESKWVESNLNDGSWDLSELTSLDAHTKIDISCVLEIKPNEETKQYEVLTGMYESKKLHFNALSDIVKVK